MATRTVFRYVDGKGDVHEVGSMGEVPHKYIRTMEVVGIEEPEEAAPAAASESIAQPSGKTPAAGAQGLPGAAESIHLPLLVAAAVLLILVARSKSFLVKIMAGLAAAGIGFYALYTGAEDSGFFEFSEKKVKPQPAVVEEVR